MKIFWLSLSHSSVKREMRFPDDLTLQAHKKCAHSSRGVTRPPVNIDQKTINMKALKEELHARGAF